MVTDPISDMLTRIRNAGMARKTTLTVPGSRIKKAVLDILVTEGYIASVTEEVVGAKKTLTVTLKEGKHLTLTRVSKPGRRKYSAAKGLRPVQRGEGIAILTTSKGILTHIAAKKANIGGELLCEIY